MSLEGVRLKIERAHKHLTMLREACDALVEGRAIVGHFEAQASEYVFSVEGDPPPIDLGIRVGEFAHNLRSALDNIYWLLVQHHAGVVDDRTQFPIYEDRLTKQGKSSDKAVVAILTKGGMAGSDDGTFIQASQPYQPGRERLRDPLALLAYLNNVDKHRFVHPAYAANTVRVPGQPPIPAFALDRAYWRDLVGSDATGFGPFDCLFINCEPALDSLGRWFPRPPRPENRTELVRVLVVTSNPFRTRVEMEPRPAFEISLSDADRPMLVRDLYSIRAEVQRIFDRFAPVLTPPKATEIVRLTVIEPAEDAPTALAGGGVTPPLVTFAGGPGSVDFVCGKCGQVLLEGAHPSQIHGVILRCAACGSYNGTTT